MREILRRAGVPDEAISLEDKAVNTWDSAVRVAGIVRKLGSDRVQVVSDPLHCVRTAWAFREMGLTVRAEPVYDNPMWQKLWSRREQLVREATALIWYRVRYRTGSRFRQ